MRHAKSAVLSPGEVTEVPFEAQLPSGEIVRGSFVVALVAGSPEHHRILLNAASVEDGGAFVVDLRCAVVAKIKKCGTCFGQGIVSPHEYETETCPACGGKGVE